MDGEFSVHISTESMPNLRGSKKKKKAGKTKYNSPWAAREPRMVSASFQAGSDDINETQA